MNTLSNSKINILIDCHVFDGKFQGTRTYIQGLYSEMIKHQDINFFFAANDIENLEKEFGNAVNIKYIKLNCTGSLKQIATYVRIGNNVGLGTHGYYGCGVGFLEIGDNTIFGNYVSVHPENHNYSSLNVPIRDQGVTGKGVVIGAKVTILDGTRLGNGCVVAAGAVVKGEFPDNCIIGDVPAKVIKMR